jgi:hypothetical protein
MKKLLLSILLLSSSLIIFAQSPVNKSTVFIGLGPSFPIGDFSAKDASDEKSGLAATGFYFDLGYQYQFTENFGAIGMYKWKTHGIAKGTLNYAVPTGSGGSASVHTTNWKMGAILAGVTQTFALSQNEKFSIAFREVAGVQFTSTPALNISYNIPGIGNSSSNQESQSATSFAYLLGIGFKYQLDQTLGLKVYADLNNANVEFKEFTVNSGAATVTAPSSKQKTGTIDLGLGLTIGF